MVNLLITHNDLDAVGCAIVFVQKYPDITIQYHDYTTITEISQRLLNGEDKEYDKVYFADISPDEKEGLQMLNNDKYFIIDHHKTRTYLATIESNCNSIGYENVRFDIDYCAAYLSYRYLYPDGPEESYYICRTNCIVPDFIQAIDAWDSWKLDSKYRKYGEYLNLLLGYHGQDVFIKLYDDMPDFLDECDSVVVGVLNKMKTDYLEYKLKQVKTKIDENGNDYLEVHIGEVRSGMGNLLEMRYWRSPIKYLKTININDGLVSLYSIGNFDVSELAKKNGGGGHAKAAGYTIKDE